MMRPISQILQSPPPPQSSFAPPVAASRRESVISLDEMTTAHLPRPEQRERLEAAIEGAKRWLASRNTNPGQSFVVTGPVGTGKTTIVENLRRHAVTTVCALEWSDGRLVPVPGTETEITSGRLVNASLLMALLDPGRSVVDGWGEVGRSSLATMFGRADIIAVDDCGREQIPYTAAANIDAVRQSRYWEFIDWCYRRNKSLLLSSNTPLLIADASRRPEVNPQFVAIIGDAAFSRLHEMAAGFMFDLTGLPDYRRVIATKNRGKL